MLRNKIIASFLIDNLRNSLIYRLLLLLCIRRASRN